MPTVQFVRADRGITITRSVPCPKKVYDINAWLKTAAKFVAPLNSLLISEDGWFVVHSSVSIKWVQFRLQNRIGETADVVIDRTTRYGS